MTNDGLIGKLVADLKPIRPRSIRTELLLVGAAGLLEFALYLGAGAARPDITTAVIQLSFWWKLISLAVIAAAGVIFAVHSFNPTNSPRASLRWLAVLAGVSLAVGWALNVASSAGPPLLARLRWQDGISCMFNVVALSAPVLALLTFFMRKGAPVDGRSSALIVGAAGAAWGALVFAFHCNHDDPLYIAVWYGGAVGVIALLARVLLSRLVRW
jgi:hypothetical protein